MTDAAVHADLEPDILALALDYASRGWAIFPVAGKHPIEVAGGRRLSWSRESTTDPEQIVAWYAGSSGLGIGLDCGKSGLVALDGDRFQDFTAWLGDTSLTHGAAFLQGNPTRGTFLYRQPDETVGCPKMEWGEIKGKGGYIVLPGSPHPEHGRYRWLVDVPDPIVLPEAIRSRLTGTSKTATGYERVPDEWLTAGDPCAQVQAVLATAIDSMTYDAAHPQMLHWSMRLLRLGEQGHEGVEAAAVLLADHYTLTVTSPRPGKNTRSLQTARGELARAFEGAVPEIRQAPTDPRPECTGPTCDPFRPREVPDWLAELSAAPVPAAVPAVEAPAGVDPEAHQEAWRQWVEQRLPVLDWRALWDDDSEQEWIVEPLLPARRLVALYSAPKVGKSLLLLEVAAAVSCGREVLGYVPKKPYVTLYVDYENDPRGDIRERLQGMGYEPEHLGNLRYLSFPTMAALDGEQGSQELMAAVHYHGAELVVIDTVSRSVAGDENENDTWLSFYRHTGLKLKQAGVSLIRLDHSGKDETKGQRGGSAKVGDVDAVWRMSKVADEVFTLECEANRFPLVEKLLTLRRVEDPDLRHKVDAKGNVAAWNAQLDEWERTMREAGVLDMGEKAAYDRMKELRAAGKLEKVVPKNKIGHVKKRLAAAPKPFEWEG